MEKITSIFIFGVISTVASVSLQQQYYVSQKSRDNLQPQTSGYVYKQVGDRPGTLSTFDSKEKRNIAELNSGPILKTFGNNQQISSVINPANVYSNPISSLPNDFLLKPSHGSFTTGFLPIQMKSDAMFEQLKSKMQLPVQAFGLNHNENENRYAGASQGLDWSKYHNPHDYEQMRIAAETERAKDKRFVADAAKIIPIHEDLSHDIPNSKEPLVTTDTSVYFYPNAYNSKYTPNDQSGFHFGDFAKTGFQNQGSGARFDASFGKLNPYYGA